MGNALTDILAVMQDDTLLRQFHLPKGSMQHVDMKTGDRIWQALKQRGVQYVAGGSAANTITGTAIFGMPSGFIGKVGDDELGHLFKSDQEQYGIKSTLLKGVNSSGRAMVFITAPNAERTFAVYLGAALELVPEDLKPEFFEGYDYFHIEGYLVQNQSLIRRAVELAKAAGCVISLDMASYNVVESNEAFLHDIVEHYVDIVFANESEARSFTRMSPRDALDEIAKHCSIAVVKIGKDGSMVKSGDEYHYIEAEPQTLWEIVKAFLPVLCYVALLAFVFAVHHVCGDYVTALVVVAAARCKAESTSDNKHGSIDPEWSDSFFHLVLNFDS